MRLDKYLKVSRLIKRRTVAKEACDKGRVEVNGRVAKAGTDVGINDTIIIRFGNSNLEIRILASDDNVKKEDAASLYEIISKS